MNINKLALYIINDKIDISSLHIILSKYNLNNILPDLLHYIKKYNKNEEEVSESRVHSPFIISSENIDMMEKRFNIKIDKQIIDKSVIGGYKLYTKDKIIDNSLNHIIRKLK